MVVSPSISDLVVTTKAAKVRRSYEIKEKRQVVCQVDALLPSGLSRRRACENVGVRYLYYRRWKKLLEKVDSMKDAGHFIPYNLKGNARKIHVGREGILKPFENELKAFVFKVRDQGVQLTNRMIAREASRLVPSFKEKSERSRILSVSRFTRSIGLTLRAATHTAQKHHVETAADAQDFIAMVKQKLEGRNHEEILNMDQTPIPFSYHSNKTLNIKGARTVHTRASTSDTKRVTLAVTVTATGKMLPPFLIFKGKPNGRIAMREFSTYPAHGRYACQEKAWMDEVRMHEWVETVLKPWKDERDENHPNMNPPILILDAYRVHQMGSVVNRIQMMGIEVLHIPAGCTYLCQPVDVGINKPMKCGLRGKWEEWMVEGDGIVNGQAKEPSRKMVAEWVTEVYSNIPETVGINAWKKEGYEWF